METQVKVTKAELKKLSRDFRVTASRLLKTVVDDGMSNLRKFIDFIERNPVIYDLIFRHHSSCPSKFEEILTKRNDRLIKDLLPDETPEEEIFFIYRYLKWGVEEYGENKGLGYWVLANQFIGHSKKIQDTVDAFNKRSVLPFVNHIDSYLHHLQIDMGEDEQKQIVIQIDGDNYGDNLGSTMSQTNIDQKNSSIGVGVNQGQINTKNLAGTINSSQVNEVLRLIETLHQNVENIPSDHQDVAIESLETLKAEVTTPTKTSKLKTALIALWGVGKDIANFANAVSAIAERLGVHLPG
jgi:hypothetical protein